MCVCACMCGCERGYAKRWGSIGTETQQSGIEVKKTVAGEYETQVDLRPRWTWICISSLPPRVALVPLLDLSETASLPAQS